MFERTENKPRTFYKIVIILISCKLTNLYKVYDFRNIKMCTISINVAAAWTVY